MLKEHEVVNGKYTNIKFIAEGGTSYLYEVEGQQGKTFILKIVKEATTLYRQQLENESKILATLNQPGIPILYDKFRYKQQYPAIVIEKIPGKNIAELVEQDKRTFEWRDILLVAKRMANIIKLLHHYDPAIIVRDIKPSNVILTKDLSLYMVDFGAAVFLGTNATSALGTIGFAAPEQFEKGVIDKRSDLFSIGATLFFMISNGGNLYTVDHEEIVKKRLPKSFANIILKLTKMEKESRYQTIDELIYALEKVKLSWKERLFFSQLN